MKKKEEEEDVSSSSSNTNDGGLSQPKAGTHMPSRRMQQPLWHWPAMSLW